MTTHTGHTPLAYFHGFIVTANPDGSIPLNSKVIAKIDEISEENAEKLLNAWNTHADLIAALEHIACFGDLSANENLKKTGSYSAFDEPGAVQTARNTLKATGKESAS